MIFRKLITKDFKIEVHTFAMSRKIFFPLASDAQISFQLLAL